ncbi:MAG TPA: S49 family peptidase [Micavibrio sp.]
MTTDNNLDSDQNTLKQLRAFLQNLPVIGSHFEDRPKGAVLRLSGVIMDSNRRNALSLTRLAKQIEKAFSKPGVVAVALAINSPGGSAAQSSLIADEIRHWAEEKDIPVYAFVEDVAASGGYWLACAADEIYTQNVSIVGSIGVISAGFGLEDFIEKHDIHRRLYTAGHDKSMLDPFLPEKAEDIERLKTLQKDLHHCFIDWVRERRGHMLKASDHTLFEGRFWTAQTALELGLIDGVRTMREFLTVKFGDRVKLLDITAEKRLLPQFLPFMQQGSFSAEGIGDELLQSIEAKALWARYGL